MSKARGNQMDEVARGMATAALTLQSALLQALVAHGAMSPEQALEVVDLAMEASTRNRHCHPPMVGQVLSPATEAADRAIGDG